MIKIRASEVPQLSDVTPLDIYRTRRAWMAGTARTLLGSAGLAGMMPAMGITARAGTLAPLPATDSKVPGAMAFAKLTSYEDVTHYNNFYEFGVDKADPARLAGRLRTRPWRVLVDGEVRRPRTFTIEELLALAPMEERIYRMRCVEGWSMVIPWIGYSLATVLHAVEPTPEARFVAFTSLGDASQMPGINRGILNWPYSEGLRLDEAQHPLAMLAFGLYGEVLPNQNGAPMRLVVPWKYGFKSAKSIVHIRLSKTQPPTAWNQMAPQEYGFYSNVNPEVDHPRWSQKTERRIGEDGLFSRGRPTLMFNGYGPQVASLYSGMDLRRNF